MGRTADSSSDRLVEKASVWTRLALWTSSRCAHLAARRFRFRVKATVGLGFLAEGEGFEPSIPVNPG
jgi:hypothetical protein